MSDNLPPMPEHWVPYGLVGTNATFQRAAREYAEDYARAAIDADRVSRDVPACRVADRGFRWDGDRQEHVQQLVIEFDAAPFDAPYDSKGWVDRDRLASLLAASTQPQPVEQAGDDADWIAARHNAIKAFHTHQFTHDGSAVLHPDCIANALREGLKRGRAGAQPVQAQPSERDPCPGCQVGHVCRTPKCGRLKLPLDHPYRTGKPAKQAQKEE